MSYCSHCGSQNAPVTPSPNTGYTMYVAEESDCATECYDPDIEMLKCDDCGGITYKSINVTPTPILKPKTTKILGGVGSRQVMWFIDGEWVHKGWLLPQVG